MNAQENGWESTWEYLSKSTRGKTPEDVYGGALANGQVNGSLMTHKGTIKQTFSGRHQRSRPGSQTGKAPGSAQSNIIRNARGSAQGNEPKKGSRAQMTDRTMERMGQRRREPLKRKSGRDRRRKLTSNARRTHAETLKQT